MNEKDVANKWALEHYKALAEETMLAVFDELQAHVTGAKTSRILSSVTDAYALASRFKGVLYKYPFFKKKHIRILHAIVDRCGEAYYEKNPYKLYISKAVVEEWSNSFLIPIERTTKYLKPLQIFNILKQSDDPKYVYRVSDEFFQLVGPVAQYLVTPVDTRRFTEMMAIVSGISSVYVIATGLQYRKQIDKPLIPWFLKLPMIYTLSGYESTTNTIRDVLEIARIRAVDEYFVIEKGVPVELWRSIRAEAFEFMSDNYIIEQAVLNGYKLYNPWVRMHEEGIKRYVRKVRERYEKRYRWF